MVHNSNTMWRMNNRPSNSTSGSDNALRLLLLVTGKFYWGLQVTSSFSIRGCILKGCFERGIFCLTNSCLKGIEDFNLEHCLHSTWTLLPPKDSLHNACIPWYGTMPTIQKKKHKTYKAILDISTSNFYMSTLNPWLLTLEDPGTLYRDHIWDVHPHPRHTVVGTG